MLFQSDFKYKAGDSIVATVLLPGGTGILFQGEIIYSKPGPGGVLHYGVKFKGVAIHHKRMVRNYVSAKTQAEAEAETEFRDTEH